MKETDMKNFNLEAALDALYGQQHDCAAQEGLNINPISEEEIATYIDAELDQQDVLLQYPRIYAHLAHCASCRAEYEELKTLFALQRQQDASHPAATSVPTLVPTPAINYHFLKSAKPEESSAQSPWRLEELGSVIIAFTQQLLDSLAPPTQHLAYAKEAPGASPKTLLEYHLDEIEDLEVKISGKQTAKQQTAKQQDVCSLAVSVNIPSRGGWPNLVGTDVTLSRDGEVLSTGQTDAFGNIIFHNIATEHLPTLEFKITAM